MNKTYIIKEKIFKEISTSRGSICYLLEDGQGEKRTVRAIARLGFTKKIKSVQPIYYRETPLVESLSKASLNDSVSIDFLAFNKYIPRTSASVSQANALKILRDVEATRYNSRLSSFSVDPERLLQLFLMASVGFMDFLAI